MQQVDWRRLLDFPAFRALLRTRMTGQFSDGVLQAALTAFVLFSPERQPSATAIAISFTILLLPYSLIGPFIGVLLDRWSRQRVLVVTNLIRAATVACAAILVAGGQVGIWFVLLVLVALALNRLLLAALSASIPHTVDENSLLTANAVAPIAGTAAAAIGALIAVAVREWLGATDRASAEVMAVAAVGFVVAAGWARWFARDQLGPSGQKAGDTPGQVVRGMIEGLQVIHHNVEVRRAIGSVIGQRIVFGLVTVVSVLLLRTVIHPPDQPDAALTGLALATAGAGAGAFVGAIITPRLTLAMGADAAVAMLLGIAAIAVPAGLFSVTTIGLIIGAFTLGLAGQGLKVTTDAIVQTDITDDHLGRVFSVYDVGINLGLLVGVVAAAWLALLGPTSVVYPILAGVILAAVAAWRLRPRARVGA